MICLLFLCLCCFDVRYHRSWRGGVNGGMLFLFCETLMIYLSCSMISMGCPIEALRSRLINGAQMERPETTFEKSVSNQSVLWGADSQECLFPVHKVFLLTRATLSTHFGKRLVIVKSVFFSVNPEKEHGYQPVSAIECESDVYEILANSCPAISRVGMFSGGGLV